MPGFQQPCNCSLIKLQVIYHLRSRIQGRRKVESFGISPRSRTNRHHSIFPVRENIICVRGSTSIRFKSGFSCLNFCLTACLYARLAYYVYHYRFVCNPMRFKSRNHIQIKTKCKISMLFQDQNVMLFPMVHLFLQ